MRLLVNFASRSRPEKFFKCLDNLRELSTLKNYFVIAKLDTDDISMNNPEVKERLQYYPEVQTEWGLSHHKVSAINRDIGAAREMWDILINLSDDQLFITKGFDEIIVNDMIEYFPDRDGFLHYPDSHCGKKVPVMSIIGNVYYKRDNYVYHPDFSSWYADNYAMDVAKKRGLYRFIDKKIFDHYHPRWKTAQMDDQYRISENKEIRQKDRRIYANLKYITA